MKAEGDFCEQDRRLVPDHEWSVAMLVKAQESSISRMQYTISHSA